MPMEGRGIHDNGLSEDTSTVLRDGSIDGGNIQIIYITQTSHTIWCDEPWKFNTLALKKAQTRLAWYN